MLLSARGMSAQRFALIVAMTLAVAGTAAIAGERATPSLGDERGVTFGQAPAQGTPKPFVEHMVIHAGTGTARPGPVAGVSGATTFRHAPVSRARALMLAARPDPVSAAHGGRFAPTLGAARAASRGLDRSAAERRPPPSSTAEPEWVLSPMLDRDGDVMGLAVSGRW